MRSSVPQKRQFHQTYRRAGVRYATVRRVTSATVAGTRVASRSRPRSLSADVTRRTWLERSPAAGRCERQIFASLMLFPTDYRQADDSPGGQASALAVLAPEAQGEGGRVAAVLGFLPVPDLGAVAVVPAGHQERALVRQPFERGEDLGGFVMLAADGEADVPHATTGLHGRLLPC